MQARGVESANGAHAFAGSIQPRQLPGSACRAGPVGHNARGCDLTFRANADSREEHAAAGTEAGAGISERLDTLFGAADWQAVAGRLPDILNEIVTQSMVEFNYLEE